SWLGGFTSASFPRRRLANVSLQCPALCCFRLTVGRRRRLALRPPAISAAHRLPVHEACGYCSGRFRPLWVTRSRVQQSRVAKSAKFNASPGFLCILYSLLSSTFTRGLPFTLCSTVSCVWKTCSSKSRWYTLAGVPTRKHLPFCIKT